MPIPRALSAATLAVAALCLLSAAAPDALARAAAPGQKLKTVRFGLDWKAEAEDGGYFQAIAKGIYARHGIKVELRQGGPQVNQAELLAAGRLDFSESANSFIALNFVRQKIPMVAVAAMFQKDPQVLIAHAGHGYKSLADLKGHPIMIGSDTRAGSWLFLKARFGFTDAQIRPYAFSVAPFLANPNAVQQGYLSSEPYLIEKAGQKPQVFLLADEGYTSYGAVISTSRRLATADPDLVQRFVDATIEGWHSYLHDDPTPANELIKRANPEMTDALLAYGRSVMIRHGIVESGDALKLGIGAMTEARWRDFFQVMAKEKLYPAGMDYRQAFMLRFVNQRVGMAARAQ